MNTAFFLRLSAPVAACLPGARRILYADDEPMLRRVAALVLRRAGYFVAEAADGDEAWSCLGTEMFDLLITDQRMPGLTGLELVRKARSRGCAVPAILASGVIDEELRAHFKELSQSALLVKPFTPEHLLDAVEEALKTNPRAAVSPDATTLSFVSAVAPATI